MRTVPTIISVISFTVFILTLVGCGIHSNDVIYTPTAGKTTYIPDNTGIYDVPQTVSPNAPGDGWTNGTYSQGYGGAGQADNECLGAACYCPTGWTSATFTASMLLLAPTASGAMSSGGKAALTTENDIHVNSSSASAITTSNNNTITAPNFYIVGNHSGPLYGTVLTGQTALADPLQFLPYPDPSQLTVQSTSTYMSSGSATLEPGVYHGGISLSSGAKIVLNPGLYYIDGGSFTVGSQASVIGSEVTIFIADANATSTITISGGASAQLSPPADGYLKGLTLFFHRSNTSTVTITGGGNLKIYGSIYVPGAIASLGGNGSMVAGSQIVAQKTVIQGNSTTQITTAGGLYALPPGCFAP